VVQGSSPLIWRRLLIRRDVCLATPHATRQIVFARSEVHLHDFRIRGKAHGCRRLSGPHVDGGPRHVPLADLH
jgi:hypothetical protein